MRVSANLVFCQATDTSPRTSRSLSLTNKCLLEAIKVIRSRRKIIKFDKDRRTYEPVNFDSSAFTNANYLTIEASELSDPHLLNQAFIVQLLEIIQNLKTLTWNVGPISIDVLSALNRLHPRCTLRIFTWWRLDGDLNHLDETEIALTKFKNLTHFRYVTVSNPSSEATLPEAYSWEPFQEIVANSHNLELASFLSSSIYRDVEAPGWVGEAASRAKARQNAKHNALKSLTIDCPNLTLSSSTLREIDSFTDLSALEYLKFSRGRAQDYFQVAATMLPNLKHISLNFNDSFDDSLLKAAGDYLRTCSSVQTLSLWGWTRVISLPDLVGRHGSTLQVLQLHEKDCLDDRAGALKLSDVNLLMESCPELSDITIDLDISAQYNVRSEDSAEIAEILGVIAARKPRRIQIYLSAHPLKDVLLKIATEDADVETTVTTGGPSVTTFPVDRPTMQADQRGGTQMIAHRSKYILPIVKPCATAMWNILYGRSTCGERILDLKFGDWETRSALAPPAGEPRTFCQVRPHERDDRVGRCVVRTKYWSRYAAKGVEIQAGSKTELRLE